MNDVSMFCKKYVGLSVSQSHLHTMMFQMVDSETPFDSAQLGASFFGMLSACHKWRDIRYLQSTPSGKAPSNYISLSMEKQELRSETLEDLSCLAPNLQYHFTIRL